MISWSKRRIVGTKKYEMEDEAAQALSRQAVQEQEKKAGKSHVDKLNSNHWLGRTLCLQKKYQEAEELLRKAAQEQERELGKSHADTLYSKHWLGRTLCLQKKYGEAEELFRHVWQEQEKKLIENHVDKLDSKHWLGRTLCLQKKDGEAEELVRKAMQEQGKELGKSNVETISKHWLRCTLCERKNGPGFDAGTSASIEEYSRYSFECLHCRLLLHTIDQLYPGWIDKRKETKFVEISDVRLSWHSQPYIQLRLAGEGLIGAKFDNIEIRIDADNSSTWNVDPRGSLSRFEWEQAESWLKNCVDHHAICRIPRPHFVPKRLVQVMNGDSSLRLVERDDSQQRCAKYCALSYCWGPEGNALTTRKETLGRHLKGMDFSSMPQTIQDALIVCQSLNIPYLWVDGLCIIQNDDGERDWYEQSSEMCDIYSSAHLVISADASPSGNFGFLPGRDHHNKQWRTVRVSDTASDRQLIASVRAHKAYSSVFYNGRAWDGKSIHPLLQRGWALQESMLANRLLRFTSDGMKWECNHVHQDQTSLISRAIRLAKLTRMFPNLKSGLPQNELNTIYKEEEVYSRHITDFMNQNTTASIYHAWQGIVSSYSHRTLTKSADKLSALSGLVRLVSEALDAKPEEYLAGHWKGDLASSLLWYVGQPKIPNRTSSYRAPSWSWASINGQIRYFDEQYQLHFKESLEINWVHCHSSPLDPFGRVTSGKLSVTGLLVPVSLHISATKSHTIQYTANGGCAGHPYTDQFSWVSLLGESSLEPADHLFYYEVLLDDKISAKSLSSMHFKCLLVGKHLDTMTGGCRKWWLVLRRTLADEDAWERIGMGYFHEYSKNLALFDNEYVEMQMITLV